MCTKEDCLCYYCICTQNSVEKIRDSEKHKLSDGEELDYDKKKPDLYKQWHRLQKNDDGTSGKM